MATAAEIKSIQDELTEHNDFINGKGNEIGAKTRLALIEDQLKRINKATGYIIAACITVITGVVIWLITDVLPAAISRGSLAMLVK